MKKDSYGRMERLLDMTEHPDRYTDEQLNELLRDDELRQTYQLLSEAASAYEYGRASDKLTDEVIEEEWHKLMEKKSTSRPVHHYNRQIAAAVIGVLTVSGIALAAVSIVKGGRKQLATNADVAVTDKMAHTETLRGKDSIRTASTYNRRQETGKEAGETVLSRQFDNVMLQDIVREIAGYYGIRTVCRNPEAGRLRLRFLWNRDQSVERAVETLNSFEKVQLTLADSTITIE
ncbi:DUF4974 domain-containing protein [Prevotella denticola]|uniref:DUF4974 domain-containing protein n=1 Tax=Prevotella denticola TaxID=28129 RepID=UPI0002013FE7|nr:DUF4974 domain-containing protein [Prevotella denticola]AEA20134.1 hypothetical protein HMPREF9137_0488 [Prevotella denticola F0289]MBW4897311.1 DUF4974 domain-containing protein [Prevotella denticola]QUB88167.1 DUF4974 domain-containing protein [Prevotella denticola]